MNKYLLLAFCMLLLLSTPAVKSQDKAKVDSLEKVLKYHKANDTTKVNLWNEIAYEVSFNDKVRTMKYAGFSAELSEQLNYPKGKAESFWLMGIATGKDNCTLAICYFQKALKIAELIQYKPGIAKYLNNLGIMYKFQGDNAKALSCYKKSIQISEQINDQRATAKFLLNLSVFYSGQGEYTKAIDGYRKALLLLEEINDYSIKIRCLNNLGSVYEFQGNYPQALEYFQSSLKIAETVDDTAGCLINYLSMRNIHSAQEDYLHALEYARKALRIAEQIKDQRKTSLCLLGIGEVLFKTNNSQALDYFQRALQIVQKCNDKLQTATVLISIGDYYLWKNNNMLALQSYEDALLLSEELGKKRLICNLQNKIGSVHLKQGKYAVALKFTQQSLALAEELNVLDIKKDIHLQLSEIYSSINDYRNAFVHHKLYAEINAKVYNEKNTKKIAALEYAYKFDKEKHTLELLQQKKDAVQSGIVLTLIVGIVLLLIFAIYVFRSLQIKHRTNQILINQKEAIEKLNEEYLALNKEYVALNMQLNQSNIQISSELELNQKSMTAAALKLIQNSERDTVTIERLLQIEQYTSVEAKHSINSLISDYKRSSFNSNWDEFEILFEKVHSSFYEKLNDQFPTLTANERKLCAFLKLNMSSKDIAHITFQSNEALKKARLRLRQKLRLDRETNLTGFLHNF